MTTFCARHLYCNGPNQILLYESKQILHNATILQCLHNSM